MFRDYKNKYIYRFLCCATTIKWSKLTIDSFLFNFVYWLPSKQNINSRIIFARYHHNHNTIMNESLTRWAVRATNRSDCSDPEIGRFLAFCCCWASAPTCSQRSSRALHPNLLLPPASQPVLDVSFWSRSRCCVVALFILLAFPCLCLSETCWIWKVNFLFSRWFLLE